MWPSLRLSITLLVLPTLTACDDGSSDPVDELDDLDEKADGTHQDPQEGRCEKPWSYTGADGPDHWSSIDEAYGACADGHSQSPIDIRTSAAVASSELAQLGFDYHEIPFVLLNNSRAIEAEPDGEVANGIEFVAVSDGSAGGPSGRFELVNFHFHGESEHTVDGVHAAMEMHIVHRSAAGALAVVGVMLQEGQANEDLQAVFAEMSSLLACGAEADLPRFDLTKALPASTARYAYSGSLTTPPCSEGVHWNVMAEPLEVSAEQIAMFREVFSVEEFPAGTGRPVQALNGRAVYRSAEG